ncbi:DNA repair protein RecO [Patescibacteria group bacterium]|nr:DNA repair protein RecO [Patescibacteria group bacterium]
MKHRSRNFHSRAIVLKRSSVGETDRIVTLLTQEYGRLVAIAKGVRKLSSTKRASLEPGNYIQAYFIKTKSLPLLIQTKLLDDSNQIRNNLAEIRKLTQFLEILEKLFVEEEIEAKLYQEILNLRKNIVSQKITNRQIKISLENLIGRLGYPHLKDTEFNCVLDYVSALADKPMRSFEYLTLPDQ